MPEKGAILETLYSNLIEWNYFLQQRNFAFLEGQHFAPYVFFKFLTFIQKEWVSFVLTSKFVWLNDTENFLQQGSYDALVKALFPYYS